MKKKAGYVEAVERFLEKNGTASASDLFGLMPDGPVQTSYSRIRKMRKDGLVETVGRGVYRLKQSSTPSVEVTPLMLAVNDVMVREFEGVDFCLSDKGDGCLMEVNRKNITKIRETLANFPFAADVRIRPLITDAPLDAREGIPIPSVEKELIDRLCEDGLSPEVKIWYQRAFDCFSINANRLERYAGRRGKKEENKILSESVDYGRVRMFGRIRSYLKDKPFEKVWLFGSFSRKEEDEDSDIDLLFKAQRGSGMSLWDMLRYQKDLEELTGRNVDLVEEGTLRDFAKESAERDKYLIYAG